MQIYFHSRLCSYLSRVPILVEDTVYIFFMSVRQAYMEFCAQLHGDRDGRKCILFAFIILQKHSVLLLLWVLTNKRRVFTDSKDVLFLSVWPKMREYFRSKWAHRRLHLSCSEHAAVQLHTPHRNLNSAQFIYSFIFSVTKRLIKFWSTTPLLVD